MQKIYFPPDLQRAVALCRYAIYAFLGLLLVLQAYRTDSPSINWLAICICQAIIVQWLLQRTIHRSLMQSLYLLEWLWVVIVVLTSGLPVSAAASVLLVVLVCYTTLWGGRWCLLTLGWGLFWGWASDTVVGITFVHDAWVAGLAVSAAAVFMLVICSIAHHQVRQQLAYGLMLKQQNSLLLRYLPRDLPAYLRDGHGLPVQRQWASVMFIDVVGFTRSVQALPLEELTELLDRFFDRVHETVEQWGGSVTKFLGDGALCIFPCLPHQQQANVACQALRCAQLLPAQVSRGATTDRNNVIDLKLSLGLASGNCCIGQWGGARRDFTVIGTPVNLANRLQRRAASHGGLLLDATTATLAGEAKHLRAPLKLNLPGFGTREVYAVPLFRFDK